MEPKEQDELNILVLKVLSWANDRNIIEGATSKEQGLKLGSEVGELHDALLKGNKTKIMDGIGDSLVVLTIIAQQEGMTLQECLAHAYDEIKDRRGVLFNGTFIKETDDSYENAIKQLGR